MTAADHHRVKELFVAVCGLPVGERRALLESECGSDEVLRQEVEELLGYHAPEPPRRIGPYRLVRRIGEGGMGVVWEAEQEKPVRRRVALKVILAGMDSRQVVTRFESERQALAVMDHPNVAKVFDAGTTEAGHPYFVMEYLDGEPITLYCDRHRLTTRERVGLLITVCEAVHHAHQKGIIHRDIKPSNILVQTVDGRPAPKVIDFGVAKAMLGPGLDPHAATSHGMLIGTPGYMSPEQAATSGTDVDTRADVYSLGILIYEVLVGHGVFTPPLSTDQSLEETLRRIREEEAVRPSTRVGNLGIAIGEVARKRSTSASGLRRQLRGDLDWTITKALEKDRERRYPSAAELAADMERHLRNEGVLACPPSLRYRAHKFFLRHRAGVLAAAALVLALVIGAAGIALGSVRARQESEAAQRVSELLLGTFEELNPNVRGMRVASAVEILDGGMTEIETKLGRQPVVQARLFSSMGQAYLALGLFPQAMDAMSRTVAIRRGRLGLNDLATQASINELVEVLLQWGDLAGAEELLVEVREVHAAVEEPDPASVSWTLQNLGVLKMRQRRLTEAQQSLNEALQVGLSAPDATEFAVARIHFWLGAVEWLQADLEASWLHTRRSLQLLEETVGELHPYMGWPLFQVGLLHSAGGEPDSAAAYYRRAIDLEEHTLGPNHPNLAYPLQALGGLLAAQGDPTAAVPLIQRALSINERSFGPSHPNLVQVLNELGVALRSAEDAQGAYAAHARALSILEASPGSLADDVELTRGLLTAAEEAGRREDAGR